MSIRTERGTSIDHLLSRRGRNAPGAPIRDPKGSSRYISFIYGFPDAESLPAATVAASTHRALEQNGQWALQYGKTSGVPELVSVLLEKLQRDQGIRATPENVLITAGGSQAVQLVLDLFVDEGDPVVAESPTWMGFVDALANVGGKLVGVPLTDDGTDTDALEARLRELRETGTPAKFIYVIPNFQNPTGVTTSLSRRERIVELAREYDTLILEDDAYHDLRFSGSRITPLYVLDDHDRTMYLGTFSKIMGAGMRLGWLIAPAPIISKLSSLKIDGGTNVFGSHVAADWVPDHLDDHIDKLKGIYKQRRDTMLAALQRYLPAGATWTEPEGGFFIWVTLPKGMDAKQMLPQARERGVDYLPGATCYTDGSGTNQIRLSFSFATEEQIEQGIRVLGEVVQGEMTELGLAQS